MGQPDQSQVKNLVEMFENSAKAGGDKTCFRFVESGQWRELNWNQVREQVQKIAGGLQKLGVQSGDRVSILAKTRYEWTLADLGILAAGGVVVPIYESNLEEQVQYIIEHSDSKVIFVENQVQYQKVKAIQDKLPHLKQVIFFEGVKDKVDGLYSLDALQMLGADEGEKIYQQAVKTLSADKDASFVYTSGTTGNPKGAILTHSNFLAELEAGVEAFSFEPHYQSLVFLPFSHILARVVQFFQLYAGFIQAYAESIDKLMDNIGQVKPHFMASVPRIFEKIHARTLQGVQNSSPGKQKIFEWAMAVGRERSRYILNGKSVPLFLSLKYKLAFKMVFSKLHEKLGGRIQFFISGGAPLSAELGSFFHAFDFTILEGYGLTETTAAISVNRFDAIKIGSVGMPIKGTEFKIAEDGEILVRGKVVFKGYYKNPEATAEAIDDEGWFHTGDIGEFDEQGFLKITDRKKDIIVTAAGKNVAPQNIENLMKSDPYISQFVVHGDKRKFLSALVTLDQDEIQKFAQNQKISFKKYDDLIENKKVLEFIKARIEEMNKKLARYETIKRFAILPSDFSVESGELTPSLKVKRKVITKKYGRILDGFYS